MGTRPEMPWVPLPEDHEPRRAIHEQPNTSGLPLWAKLVLPALVVLIALAFLGGRMTAPALTTDEAALQEENAALVQRAEALQDELEVLETRLAELEAAAAASSDSGLTARVEELENLSLTLTSENDSLAGDNAELRAQIDALERQLLAAQSGG